MRIVALLRAPDCSLLRHLGPNQPPAPFLVTREAEKSSKTRQRDATRSSCRAAGGRRGLRAPASPTDDIDLEHRSARRASDIDLEHRSARRASDIDLEHRSAHRASDIDLEHRSARRDGDVDLKHLPAHQGIDADLERSHYQAPGARSCKFSGRRCV